jgi:hypothetical protein
MSGLSIALLGKGVYLFLRILALLKQMKVSYGYSTRIKVPNQVSCQPHIVESYLFEPCNTRLMLLLGFGFLNLPTAAPQ